MDGVIYDVLYLDGITVIELGNATNAILSFWDQFWQGLYSSLERKLTAIILLLSLRTLICTRRQLNGSFKRLS